MSLPLSPAASSRRFLVAIGMVGAPICLAVGNLLLAPSSGGSPAAELQAAHSGAFLAGSVIDAAGFALLGAFGVGLAMLLPRRGSVLATIAALLMLVGGVVMAGAVLTTSFVEASLPVTAASVLQALQTSPTVGILFEFAMLAALGGILAVVALLIGRVVPVWLPILLLVGLLLSAAGGGVVGAALTLPLLAAAVLLARALIRPQDAARLESAPAQQPVTA